MGIPEQVYQAIINAKINGFNMLELPAMDIVEDLQQFDSSLETEATADILHAVLNLKYGWVDHPA